MNGGKGIRIQRQERAEIEILSQKVARDFGLALQIEVFKQKRHMPEAMRQSQHRSVQQAARYYNDAEARLGMAARLVV